MKTLFLAWQDAPRETSSRTATRGWYPIGRLDVESEKPLYTFHYTRGALTAHAEAGFQPLDAFPKFERAYESTELFPLFQNRVPNPKRGDYVDFVKRLGLTVEAANPFEILAISGGGRQTDNLEVFPKIQKRRDGTFSVRFFLHGWRHVNLESQSRLARLKEGDPLQVAVEVNNPVTGAAVQLQTVDDYHMIGWAPRYLIKDMLSALGECPGDIHARVSKVNPPPGPYNQRVLIELEGRLPDSVEPMSSAEFQGI
ncbi:MAG: DNA-binding protein [Blastocatellia bacterium]|nr:DNA-binding protein [Blastocatellia bacterium]